MIIKDYKGFELVSERQGSLGGSDMVYIRAYRNVDGWCLEETFRDGSLSMREGMKDLKFTVDDYWENPEDYDDE